MGRLLSLLLHDVYKRDYAESGFSRPGANRYKLTVAEFEAQLAGIAQARGDRPILLPAASIRKRKRTPFAVTVDDGGISYYTIVADRLERRGWRGHCLVTTGFIGRPGFLEARHLRELHARGHLIGTHSVSHPARFAACTWERMMHEWTDSRRALQDILGADVTVGSVPGGYFSGRVARAAHAAGLKVLFTSEPETRVRRVGACAVVGRYTIRAGCRPVFAGEIASLRHSTLLREWAAWNVKKVAKYVLGSSYRRLAGWAARVDQRDTEPQLDEQSDER